MRSIKFRAWDGIQMLDHVYFHTTPEGWIWDDNPCKVGVKAIMQFTGLLDKNGKEIYEGDILQPYAYRNKMKLLILTVVYKEGMFTLTRKGSSGWPLCKSLKEADKANNSYQIIGNIYDNPELLEGK